MKTICVHSYKGGTGKTTFLVNIAGMLAKDGKRVLAIDYDLRAPSFQAYFAYNGSCFISNYLLDECPLKDLIIPVVEPVKNRLDLIFSSVEFLKQHSQQRDKLSRDDSQYLAKLYQLQSAVKDKYDYLLIDTIPGFFYRSIDAMAISDVILIVLTPSSSNVMGLEELCSNVYSLLKEEDVKFALIINKIEERGVEADKKLFEENLRKMREIGKDFFDEIIEVPYLNIVSERIHAFEKEPNEQLLTAVKEIINKCL